MLETTNWMLIIAINAVMCGIFSGLWMMLGRWLADRRLAAVEADVERIVMTLNSRKGEEARSRNQEEEAAFMAQAATILKEEGEMPAKIQKIIALNPAMAIRLASKMGIRM